MLGAVFAPPANVRLDKVPAVQERHLAVLLDPHLVPRVRRNHLQRRDVQPELARLGELAHARPQREQVVPRDRRREIGQGELYVVHARAVQTENVAVILALLLLLAGVAAAVLLRRHDDVIQRPAGVIGELGEKRVRFLVRESAHGWIVCVSGDNVVHERWRFGILSCCCCCSFAKKKKAELRSVNMTVSTLLLQNSNITVKYQRLFGKLSNSKKPQRLQSRFAEQRAGRISATVCSAQESINHSPSVIPLRYQLASYDYHIHQ